MTWTTDYCRKTAKKRSGAKDQPTAPSIKWPWAWKHSGMVDRTFRRQFDFTQTPLDYRSNDLDYRLLQEDCKKAVRGQRSAHSTINKMAMGLETLRNGGQDLQKTI